MIPPPPGRALRARPQRVAGFLSFSIFALALGCGKGDSVGPPPPPQATTIALKAGDGQRAAPGSAVAIPPSVSVTDADANPVSGVPITFEVTAGGGSVSPSRPVNTDGQGTAAVTSWTLGATPGVNGLSAAGAGLTGSPVVFTATGLLLGTIGGKLTVSDALVAASARAAVASTSAGARSRYSPDGPIPFRSAGISPEWCRPGAPAETRTSSGC